MNEIQVLTLEVVGMTCSNCKRHVQEAIKSVEGVHRATVDLASGQAFAELSSPVNAEKIVAAIKDAGYQARVLQSA